MSKSCSQKTPTMVRGLQIHSQGIACLLPDVKPAVANFRRALWVGHPVAQYKDQLS